MESTRQQKTGRLVQKHLSEVFLKNGTSLYGNAMVTITMVRMNVDLSAAKIYVSIFGGESEKILSNLQKNKSQIRYSLGKLLSNKLKNIPELHFYQDDSIDYYNRIDELL